MTSITQTDRGAGSRPALGRLFFVIAALFFRLILDICYVFYLNEAFGDHFLTPMEIDFSIDRYIVSYIFLILILLFARFGKQDFSGVFFMVALVFLYIPMTSMFGFNQKLPATAMFASMAAILFAFLSSSASIFNVKIPTIKNGEAIAVRISFTFVLVFFAWSIMSGAAANINLDFDEIYFYREVAGKQLDIGFMAYINIWTQKVFNPLLFTIALYRKNRVAIILTLLVQFYFFAVTQHRAHLFTPILVYLTSILYGYKFSLARLYVITGLALASFLIVALALELDAAASIIIRRAFFVPASVTYDWIALFQSQPNVYFSDNLLSSFLQSNYTGKLIPFIVGEYFAPGLDLAFNSGIVGAGYAQAGFAGVLFYAIVLGLSLHFINTLIRRGLPPFFAAALLIAPFRTAWADSDLFSALLSHGILVGIFMLWLIGRPKSREIAKSRTLNSSRLTKPAGHLLVSTGRFRTPMDIKE